MILAALLPFAVKVMRKSSANGGMLVPLAAFTVRRPKLVLADA